MWIKNVGLSLRRLERLRCHRRHRLQASAMSSAQHESGPHCPLYVALQEIFWSQDVALDLLKRHSGIVWDPGRFRGIAPRRGREEVGEPCGRTHLGLTPLQCLGLPN